MTRIPPRAVVLRQRSASWIAENAAMLAADTAITGWLPIVDGSEAIERMKRRYGAENVIEFETLGRTPSE